MADEPTTTDERTEWLRHYEFYNRGTKPEAQKVVRLIADVEALTELLKEAVAALRVEVKMNPNHGELKIIDRAESFLEKS